MLSNLNKSKSNKLKKYVLIQVHNTQQLFFTSNTLQIITLNFIYTLPCNKMLLSLS